MPGSCALSFRYCGGAGVHRLCALRSRALSVERGFCASLFGVALGALDGEVQQLARGRVDPCQPKLTGEARRCRRQARYSSVEIQKSAMTAVPGAGIGVGAHRRRGAAGVRTASTKPSRCLETQRCRRRNIARVTAWPSSFRRLDTKPRHSRRSPPPGCGRHAPAPQSSARSSI